MKNYDVILTKSYRVRIKAENEHLAKEYSIFYTSDVKDISSDIERKNMNFNIEDIDCKINEVFNVEEVNENN